MKKQITIHGGGYVGLTAAVHYAKAGWEVIIYDPDVKTIDAINKGTPRAGEFLSYIDADVSELVSTGKLRATTNFDDVCLIQVHSIAVPTEKDGEPYDDIVTKCLENLICKVRGYPLIIIESTLTPGFIDKFLKDKIMRVGEDYFLAACPRSDWFGDKEKNLATLPRAVGGVTPECTKKAVEVLSTVSENIMPTDYRTAELCKAFQNHLYHVQIMAAYELARRFPDRNVAEALKLACTHWRLPDLYLGFGSGGRCVPLGSKYIAKSGTSLSAPTFCSTALEQDFTFRKVIAHVASRHTPQDGTILVLGMAYRPDFKDAGSSPGLDIVKWLHADEKKVFVADPMWSDEELDKLTSGIPVSHDFTEHHTILLATPHTVYTRLPNIKNEWGNVKYILDGQGAWSKYKTFFENRGIQYVQVGTPGWAI